MTDVRSLEEMVGEDRMNYARAYVPFYSFLWIELFQKGKDVSLFFREEKKFFVRSLFPSYLII